MDGNATCYRTLAVQDCLDSEGIQRLVWPARSPDLNPIKMWDALGGQVAGRNYPPTNKNTLIRALTKEWDKLPQQLLDNVVQSFPVIASTRNVPHKTLKILVFLLCICGFLYQTTSFLRLYNAYPTMVDIQIENPDVVDLPAVSLCNRNSDEAHFWLNGYVNKQNCRIWSEANPQVYVETPLHPEKLTVWCALWSGGILLQKR
ncbi:uncharacterized protein TNCV_4134801 [Trichonephila clavipes]|nr:uncharacterized protein TNCV_4134801 [Trichonephila clavipes]